MKEMKTKTEIMQGLMLLPSLVPGAHHLTLVSLEILEMNVTVTGVPPNKA